MLIRGDLWRQLGGFDPGYFFFFEETDLCAQARRAGKQVFHLPQAQAWHEQGRSARQMPAAARIEYWRSRYVYFRKHAGPGANGILRGGLLVRLLIDWLASGLTTLVTLGRAAGARHKFNVCAALWRWHFRGCPAEMGLPR